MKKALSIGFTYDVKEDYSFHSTDWRHSDFSTLAEVSSVKALFEGLGHTVYLIGNYEKLYQALSQGTLANIDIVFNIAEGISSRNRESWIPALLELNNIPYTGSDAYGLSLTLNKLHMKIIAEHLGIQTPPYWALTTEDDAIKAGQILKGPWILKPNYEGSSSGIVFAETKDALYDGCAKLLREYRQTIICEQYIDGREYNVALLKDGAETEVIGTVEVIRRDGTPIRIFDAEDKFTDTCTKIPSNLPKPIQTAMEDATVKLHQFVGSLDYNRADFRVDPEGNIYFLELNPLPSIDEESGFAKCCLYSGRALDHVLETIIYHALERYHENQIQI